MINTEIGNAKTRTVAIVAENKASFRKLDQSYALRFSLAATSAAEHAATYTSIAELVGYLAWDMVRGTSEASSYLNTLINPSITPELNNFQKDVNALMARYDYDLQKVTVQLATNIAAIGPGNAPPPPRLDKLDGTSQDFQNVLASLSLNVTFASAGVASFFTEFNGSSILPKLIKPIGAIAGRMFAKQITKVAALPMIGTSTGPIPIGPILAVIGAILTGYDLYNLRPEFQAEVEEKLKTNLIKIRADLTTQFLTSTDTKFNQIEKIQSAIGAKALQNLP